jgi:hypothetical protein
VPDDALRKERRARATGLTVAETLARVRQAVRGRLLLLKGPEVAERYPDPSLRTFADLDLIAEDPGPAWRSLVRAGFVPVGDADLYVGIHHLRPLAAPGLPLSIELHSRPKWIPGLEPPPVEALFEAAVPSVVAVDGIEALPPAHHAVLLAVHSWAHEPLRRARDMVDVAAVATGADDGDTLDVARALGAARVWRTTRRATEALLGDGDAPAAFRIWARNLPRVRERTVAESHLERLLSGFWALPPRAALARLGAALAGEVRPQRDEQWRTKARRARIAAANASVRRSEHERQL